MITCPITHIAYECVRPTNSSLQHEPLLFLHGLGGEALLWHKLIHAMSCEDYYNLNLPGHGASNTLTLHSIPLLCEQLIQFIEIYSLQNAIVVAHSLSGLLALSLIRSKNYFTKAILLSTDSRIFLHPGLIHQISEHNYNKDFFIQGFPPYTDLTIIDLIFTSFLKLNVATAMENFLDLLETDVATDKINLPCLIIMGKEDKIISPRRSRQLVKKIPHAVALELERVGHYPHLENPQAVATEIKHFLAQ